VRVVVSRGLGIFSSSVDKKDAWLREVRFVRLKAYYLREHKNGTTVRVDRWN